MSGTLEWKGYHLHRHQTRPAKSMTCEDGARALLLFHSLGSGKTLTALYTVFELSRYWKTDCKHPLVMIIAPAKVLIEVWEPAIKLLKLPADRFLLRSYDMVRIHHEEYTGLLRDIRRCRKKYEEIGSQGERNSVQHTVLIVDESHTIRTTSSQTFHAVFAIASEVDRVLLLTGTPMVNSVEDMQAQLRILRDDLQATVPAAYFVNPRSLEVIHAKDFAGLFTGRVLTHLIPLGSTDYPMTDRTVHRVPMYELQKQRYDEFDREMMTPALRALMKEGIISTALNSFLTRTRAISNTVGRYALSGERDTPELSAKFRGIRQSLIDDPKPAVVYSFYLENGVIPLKKFIDSTTELRTAIITGGTKASDLRSIINRYNVCRDVDVLFLTSAVRQGISLLRTRTVHIMESGWNESLQDQVIGRLVRYRSHEDLPESERHVQVHFWLTTLGGSGRRISTDEYIYRVAQRKMEVITRLEEILSRVRPPKICDLLLPQRSSADRRSRSCHHRSSSSTKTSGSISSSYMAGLLIPR